MSKILIKNCNLISLDEQREKYENNIDILINDDKIEKIANNIEIDRREEVKQINAEGKIVMPGFINTHAHLAMSLFKETAEEYSLQKWLSDFVWPIEAKMTEEDIYYLSLLSCIEMIKTGTTTVNDHYFCTKSTLNASKVSGVNIMQTRVLMDNDENGERRFREFEEIYEEYKDNENINFTLSIHGLYTSKEEYIEKAVKYAEKNNLLVHMHFCENTKEVEDIKKEYKVKYPAYILAKYFSNTHNVLAHCVKITDEDIEIMKKLDISVSHCPVSNLKLGCGIARINDFLKAGINVSLGTDGQGSGANMDMFESMKFASLLQKGKYEDASILSAYETIKMATINGAKALNLYNRGSIKEEKKADIIILDLENNIVTKPVNNVFSDIVYNAKGTNVITTIINGKIVMENNKLINLDEEKIYDKCKKIMKRIEDNK